MRILRDADIDRLPITSRKVAIIGYGNQGRAQALNLRDSGVEVRIGARPGGSAGRAEADGFHVAAPSEAAAWADVIALLAPDEVHGAIYRDDITANLKSGGALVFAHGFSIRFGLIEPRPDLDVLLVAPKGPGTALRDDYVAGGGLISLFAVYRDASGAAEGIALAFAAALGSGRAGILATSFAEECEADLFNEQAVLWGAIPELIQTGFDTLVEAGFAPEIAYLECLTEVKLIGDLIYQRGIAGMREAISNTAEFGAMMGGPRIVTDQTRAEMRRILADVREGRVARALIADAADGYPKLRAARARSAEHLIEAITSKMHAARGR